MSRLDSGMKMAGEEGNGGVSLDELSEESKDDSTSKNIIVVKKKGMRQSKTLLQLVG